MKTLLHIHNIDNISLRRDIVDIMLKNDTIESIQADNLVTHQ